MTKGVRRTRRAASKRACGRLVHRRACRTARARAAR
ncbi:hypothetical protein M218_00225 [Burkholderia pseudomallei MSHR338]|nr:hypothetical protein M218_00225 [Burkholderia pseudomallei MSHR338]